MVVAPRQLLSYWKKFVNKDFGVKTNEELKVYGVYNFHSLSESQQTAIKEHEKLGYEQCIRFYDENGAHKLSMVRCLDTGGIDIVLCQLGLVSLAQKSR